MRMGMQHVGRHRRLLSVIACLSTELQQDPGNLRVCFASSWGSVFFRRLKHIVACKLTCATEKGPRSCTYLFVAMMQVSVVVGILSKRTSRLPNQPPPRPHHCDGPTISKTPTGCGISSRGFSATSSPPRRTDPLASPTPRRPPPLGESRRRRLPVAAVVTTAMPMLRTAGVLRRQERSGTWWPGM